MKLECGSCSYPLADTTVKACPVCNVPFSGVYEVIGGKTRAVPISRITRTVAMPAQDDGGPIWPVDAFAGISLRDWFAGQALAKVSHLPAGTLEDFAKKAYELADAMLAQRKAPR